MRRIFKDAEIERQFARDGFFRFQLLDAEQLDAARVVFTNNDPKLDANFYSSINSKDFDYRRDVHNQLKEIIDKKLMSYFVDYWPIAYTFIAKKPQAEDTIIHPHADDTHILEEDTLVTVNVFCPLVDTCLENGALSVLPGSHKLPYQWRGFGMDFEYEKYWDVYKDRGVRTDLKAGEAVFYHDRLIHWSGPNLSDDIRPVIVGGLNPVESTPAICYQHGERENNEVELFKIDDNFWFTFDPDAKPEPVKSLGIRSYTPTKMSFQDFEVKMGWKKPSFLQKLKARF
jgi:hypothetical protein